MTPFSLYNKNGDRKHWFNFRVRFEIEMHAVPEAVHRVSNAVLNMPNETFDTADVRESSTSDPLVTARRNHAKVMRRIVASIVGLITAVVSALVLYFQVEK